MKACMKNVIRKWCGVVEWVKRNKLWWFGHMERKTEEFVQTLCVSETEGLRSRGRPVVRWKNRIKECMHD